jgi:hypothetical protein
MLVVQAQALRAAQIRSNPGREQGSYVRSQCRCGKHQATNLMWCVARSGGTAPGPMWLGGAFFSRHAGPHPSRLAAAVEVGHSGCSRFSWPAAASPVSQESHLAYRRGALALLAQSCGVLVGPGAGVTGLRGPAIGHTTPYEELSHVLIRRSWTYSLILPTEWARLIGGRCSYDAAARTAQQHRSSHFENARASRRPTTTR